MSRNCPCRAGDVVMFKPIDSDEGPLAAFVVGKSAGRITTVPRRDPDHTGLWWVLEPPLDVAISAEVTARIHAAHDDVLEPIRDQPGVDETLREREVEHG